MDIPQPTSQPGPRHQHPTLLACIACRKRHLKCDGQMPVCKRCQKTGSECSYQQSRRGYKGPRKATKGPKLGFNQTNGDENFPNTEGFTNWMETPNAPSVSGWSPSAMTGVDLEMIQDAFPIGNFQDTVTQPYAIPQDPYQKTETIPNIGLSMAMDDTPHNQVAIRSPNNALDLTSRHPPETLREPSEPGADTLVDVFYAKFNDAHPFVIPQRLYQARPTLLPAPLKSVMQFVASHFIPGYSQESLRKAAENVTSDQVPADGFKVQGLMILGMSLFARTEQEPALVIIDQAIDLALSLQMNSKNFATDHGMGIQMIEESWRRTWWDLYMTDGILASLNSIQRASRLQNVHNDVLLPCKESDYAQCMSITSLRSQSDFIDRAFAAEEYEYSSMAYKIEAVRLLGKATAIGANIFASNDEQVETLDASLANFILSLPAEKRYIVERDGRCDEVLFSAHNLIDSARILLHRPRSSLVFVQNHYPTPCTRPEATGAPISAYEVHTAKALKAANSISKAIAIRTPVSMHSPCFMCASVLAATVHLPAYSIEINMDKASFIKERLQLTINALSSVGEVWPMGRAAKVQISQFARELFAGQAVAAGRPQAGAKIQQIDIESMMENQTWLEELVNLGPGGGNMLMPEHGAEASSL